MEISSGGNDSPIGGASDREAVRPALVQLWSRLPPLPAPNATRVGFLTRGCLAKGGLTHRSPDWSIFRRNQGPRRPAKTWVGWGTLLLGQYPELVYISRTLRLRNPLRIAMRKRGSGSVNSP